MDKELAMSESSQCQRCGSLLPKNSVLGRRCPRCMLELGFESAAGIAEDFDSTIVPGAPAVIGRYRVLQVIGEGGMGTVYEAEQNQPRRGVALKIIKPGMASPD